MERTMNIASIVRALLAGNEVTCYNNGRFNNGRNSCYRFAYAFHARKKLLQILDCKTDKCVAEFNVNCRNERECIWGVKNFCVTPQEYAVNRYGYLQFVYRLGRQWKDRDGRMHYRKIYNVEPMH